MKKISMIFAVLALSACGIPVSADCTAAAALTDDDCAGGAAIGEAYSDADTYGEGGTCWQNTASADACTASCKTAVDNCSGGGGGAAGT